MKNQKINVPEGYEIDKDKSTFENIVFKKKVQLPKTIFEYKPEWFNGILNECEFRRANEALKNLFDLRNCYRQGWEPDWSDVYEAKFCINFNINNPVVIKRETKSDFLSFQDRKTAELFLENFIDLIEQAKPLMS